MSPTIRPNMFFYPQCQRKECVKNRGGCRRYNEPEFQEQMMLVNCDAYERNDELKRRIVYRGRMKAESMSDRAEIEPFLTNSHKIAWEICLDWMDSLDTEEWVRVNEIMGWLPRPDGLGL